MPGFSNYHTLSVVNSTVMFNYRTFSFAVTGVVATMAIVCHLGVQALDKATAEQCKTHAWPQAAHQIHMDWCADNGYATN